MEADDIDIYIRRKMISLGVDMDVEGVPVRRCKQVCGSVKGQCHEHAEEGSDYCAKHKPKILNYFDRQTAMDNYRLRSFEKEIGELKDSPNLKTLRDEIAILRFTLQSILNKCADTSDVILYQSTISDLVVKVEKLVTSCHKLDSNLGNTVDKTAIIKFATAVITIISLELKGNTEAIDNIANAIQEEIKKLGETDD